MGRMRSLIALFVLLSFSFLPVAADETSKDATMMKSVATESGRATSSEKTLFKQSIRSAKENVARETLDVFYRDALEAYYRSKYDDALELLNNIYNVDPTYEDVAALREKIINIKQGRVVDSKRNILDSYMRQGNESRRLGRNVQAINFWKQALAINPRYKPALRKIEEANKEMARQQYDDGYRNYKKQDYEQALDDWSNAIALDPALKDRGLMMMMTKTQLSLQKGQHARLIARASELYAQQNLAEALGAYEQILAVEPRHEEARRMSAKIKLQLGASAYRSAQNAMSAGQYASATRYWKDAVRYGYEVERSQKGLREAEMLARPKKSTVVEPIVDGKEEPLPPPVPVVKKPTNPDEANKHYRLGLAAIRTKDYHHALEELELASQYDPDNEHIYVARERARQEWKAMSGSN